MTDIYKDLKQLGSATVLPQSPEEAVLEKVANPQAGTAYCVRFTAPEFTSLCPMTGHCSTPLDAKSASVSAHARKQFNRSRARVMRKRFLRAKAESLNDILLWRRDVRYRRTDPVADAIIGRLCTTIAPALSVGNARP